MSEVPIIEQIAAVRLYEQGKGSIAGPFSYGYALRAAIATLEAHERVAAERDKLQDVIQRQEEEEMARRIRIVEVERERDAARAENFALAANQCHAPWNDEYGNHRCQIEDRLKKTQSEYERVVAERDALHQQLDELILGMSDDQAIAISVKDYGSAIAAVEGVHKTRVMILQKIIDHYKAERDATREERSNLQRTFDLQWNADQRAIKQWQEAHPDNDMVWPDRCNMVVWLLNQLDTTKVVLDEEETSRYRERWLRAELAEAKAEIDRLRTPPLTAAREAEREKYQVVVEAARDLAAEVGWLTPDKVGGLVGKGNLLAGALAALDDGGQK